MTTDAPTTRSSRPLPLKVMIEKGPGSGEFVTDRRMTVMSLFKGSDDKFSFATVHMFPGRMLKAAKDVPGEPALLPQNVLTGAVRAGYSSFWNPDSQVMIVRELPGGVVPFEIVLRGYANKSTWTEVSRPGDASEQYEFQVDSMALRAAVQVRAQIVGRWMRKGSEQDELDKALGDKPSWDSLHIAQGDEGSVVYVTGRPCVFNPDGQGNCAATPIKVTVAGKEIVLHVFADDHDRTAEKWTWARALRYLTYFHLFKDKPEEAVDWQDLGPVTDGDLLEQTKAFVQVNAGSVEVRNWKVKPLYFAAIGDREKLNSPVTSAEAFIWAMMGEPRTLECGGQNIMEAFILAAHKAGVHFRIASEHRTTTDEEDNEIPTDQPVDRIYWWARGCGTVKQLHRAAGGSATFDTLAALLAASNLNQLRLQVDYSDVCSHPILAGDVRRHEITVELVPGWKADSHWDLNPSDPAAIATAEAYAGEHAEPDLDAEEVAADPWYQRYCTAGSAYHDHTAAGRRWVMNETGRYYREKFWREFKPWDQARYKPWEPSHPYGAATTDEHLNQGLKEYGLFWNGAQSEIELKEKNIAAGSWSRSSRPFQECFSALDGRSCGVYVQVCMKDPSKYGPVGTPSTEPWNGDDSHPGGDWQPMKEACRVLGSEAGIHIDADDLWLLKSKWDEDVNFVAAYLRGWLRVRVTAVIDGDSRLMPDLDALPFGAPIAAGVERAKVLDVSERYHYNDRNYGNSIFAPDGPASKIDEIKSAGLHFREILSLAKNIMEVSSGRQLAGEFSIPWIELSAYEVGDCIDQLLLPDSAALDMKPWSRVGAQRNVDIVGLEFDQGSTKLILDDFRLAAAIDALLPAPPPVEVREE